jgi:hypothetical protein
VLPIIELVSFIECSENVHFVGLVEVIKIWPTPSAINLTLCFSFGIL